jgi:acetylornithine deacetylase
VVTAHKGISAWRVTVTGREAHSAQTHLGVSAVMAAARLMGELTRVADQLREAADPASPFIPPEPTLTIGRVRGGVAGNILAKSCEFVFDLRTPSGLDVAPAFAPFFALAGRLDAEIRSRAPEGGVRVEKLAEVPGLEDEPASAAEAFVRRLTGDNSPARAVSFASEAGQFQRRGFSVVLCGPGSIDQAHQPDEYVSMAQLERGAAFMASLGEALRA